MRQHNDLPHRAYLIMVVSPENADSSRDRDPPGEEPKNFILLKSCPLGISVVSEPFI